MKTKDGIDIQPAAGQKYIARKDGMVSIGRTPAHAKCGIYAQIMDSPEIIAQRLWDTYGIKVTQQEWRA